MPEQNRVWPAPHAGRSHALDADEITPLDVERVRRWAAIEAIDNQLAAAAFNLCADEIERLRAEYADLRARYDALVADWWES